MPVILPRSTRPAWLGEEPASEGELRAMLRPYPAELMHAYSVPARVGSVKNNDPALLEPIGAAA